MIKLSMLKPMGRLLKHIKIKALMEDLRGVDLAPAMNMPNWEEHEQGGGTREEYDKRQGEAEKAKTEFGFAIIGAVLENLEDAADDLTALAAEYKGISQEEAAQLDLIAVISEITSEEGIAAFFKSALRSATSE
jgi:hypothetical protein